MLEQASTFRPLMRQSCPLPRIALRAGKYHIVDIVAWSFLSARNGYRMLKMVDVLAVALLEFLVTTRGIIAGVVLRLQLLLNLLRGKFTLYCTLLHFAFYMMSTRYRLAAFRLRVTPLIHDLLFTMLSIVLFIMLKARISMLKVVVAMLLQNLFVVFLLVLRIVLLLPFTQLNTFEVAARLTPSMKTILHSVVPVKILRCCRMNLLATCASFVALWNTGGRPVRITAHSTDGTQPIFLRSITVETTERQKLFTSGTLLQRYVLGYNVLHSKDSYSLLSRLRMLATSLGHHNILPPDYTINPLYKQL